MNLTQPKTIRDLAADGLFIAHEQDFLMSRLEDSVRGFTGTEINFQNSPEPEVSEAADAEGDITDVPVQVRFYSNSGALDLIGKRIAVLKDGQWTWSTSHDGSPAIPELNGAQPASEVILAAARALESGNTILIANQSDGSKAAISVDIASVTPAKSSVTVPSPTHVPFEKVLIEGIGDPLVSGLNEVRAVTAFAHLRGLSIEEADHGLRIHGADQATDAHVDLIVHFLDERISSLSAPNAPGFNWQLEDISADGYFCAIEHAMWFSANYPKAAQEHVPINLESGHVLIDKGAHIEANAVIIATVNEGVFTWAWADSQLAKLRWQTPANRLRQFGIDKLVPALVRQSLPADTARELALPQAAMPILNMWKVVTVHLNEDTTGIALIDAPELQLPALSPAVESAVLQYGPPAHINSNRAFEAYQAMRGAHRAEVPSR
ncbi:DUF6882 domain-containing protein [Corynebacterium casei]|uniref:DUF6882 domain-containing protein n=1 Tax=Corynebacterium casei TaxID=160386 RepID=UPI003F9E494D